MSSSVRKETKIADPIKPEPESSRQVILTPISFSGEARAEMGKIGQFLVPRELTATGLFIKVTGTTEFKLTVGQSTLVLDALMVTRQFNLNHKVKEGDVVVLEARSIADHFTQVSVTLTFEVI